MSYPYDINPWDDNYDAAANQMWPGQGNYHDGYSNPMAQYSGPEQSDRQQYQGQQSYGANPGDTSQQPPPPQSPPSAIRKFVNQHLPIVGNFLDAMSGISLPFIDALVQHVNRDLLVSKMFYFFFYSAFGSLFPLMGVYFKQLGMNPAQVGVLTGVRPFIEIFSAPFWHSLAERFHKSKALLLFSLLSWIVFTYSLAHIRPPASACVAFNDTYYVLYTPYSANDLSNYDVGQLEEQEEDRSRGQKGENEIFMNKMPEGSSKGSSDLETKDEILANEESQNVRRRKRRRRRRRQVSVKDGFDRDDQSAMRARYLYKLDSNKDDDGYESQLSLNIDLESDFDDKLINQNSAKRENREQHGPLTNYKFESDDSSIGAPEYDELEQLYSKGVRLERSVDMREVDDLLGESDDSEQGDEGNKETEEEDKLDDRSREKGTSEEAEEEGEMNNDRGASGGSGNGKKDRGIVKNNQQQSSSATTTSSTSTMTTTEMTYEMASQDSNRSSAGGAVNKTKRVYKQRHKTPPTHIVGMSPITVEYAVNYNKEKHSQFVTPMFSTIVYKLDDIKEVFFLLLLLISLGEFFSAPALTLADSATLGYLGDNTDLYGRQRMFGSLSWAITLLLVGMALDNATSIADHPCGPHQRERSYTVCFVIFSLLMACAFFTATQFRFSYPKSGAKGNQSLIASTTDSNTVITTTVDGALGGAGNIDELYASTQPRSIFNAAPPINAPPPNLQQNGKEKFEFLDKWKSAVFAQRTWELPEWVNVFRQFRNSLHLTYLFITWFLGCGVGLVFTFLFWHLQDVGGTPTLFGICSVINHISEILAYFFSFKFIKRFGHTRVSIQLI